MATLKKCELQPLQKGEKAYIACPNVVIEAIVQDVVYDNERSFKKFIIGYKFLGESGKFMVGSDYVFESLEKAQKKVIKDKPNSNKELIRAKAPKVKVYYETNDKGKLSLFGISIRKEK